MVGAPACGDVMKLQNENWRERHYRRCQSSKPTVVAQRLRRARSLLSGFKGKTLDEAASIKNTDIAQELALPIPVKIHCSILAEDAI